MESRSFARRLAAAALAVSQLASAQNPGTATPEVHPPLTTWKCTTGGGCVAQNTSVVLDWNYRWMHTATGYDSCTTSSGINSTLCPNEATCAQNCVIEGANYTAAGVQTSGSSLTLNQYVQGSTGLTSASPRTYLLDSDGNYVMMQLLNQELSFDVDLSTLPCGENGALYLSEMSATGGRNEYNTGGANYGSGYCDAQCPVETFKNGTLNTNNSGFCCNEMDILEANSRANAFTPHPCNAAGTDCDKGGCGFNPYAQGNKNYWAPGGTLDTSKPFTVTTQFATNDGTKTGTLAFITRKYVQNGQVLASAVSGGDTITTSWCNAADSSAATFGSLTTMGQALGRGMVLVFSVWNDNGQYMNWLDSGNNGPCSSTEGNPATIQQNYPDTHVVFSNIKWGDIGSTVNTGGSVSSSSSSASKTTSTPTSVKTASTPVKSTSTTSSVKTTTTANGATQTHWGQCGGQGYSGPTQCAAPYACQTQNAYYAQCL
ncbi:concanavalin A-like lectin/glucanase domain-containing protein [Diplogelasinospora grovesii]|uniref:Glucanase n=1 Tax=Diplogelasinospora grovesii TaxID=303347 RepID=A0AAN6N1Y1_9PEZI|nr:concanavalin A-like lectin/glucanase domain-containing protein [Diplogelasinospora grovesii]